MLTSDPRTSTAHRTGPRRHRRALLAATASAVIVLAGCTAPDVDGPGTSPSSSAPSGPAATAPVEELVEQWADAWTSGDADAMAALFTPSGTYDDVAFQASFTGPEGVATWVGMTHEAIADAGVDVEEIVETPDRAVVRWSFSGHFVGAPTPFSVPVLTLIEISDSKISAVTDYYNRADVLAQSGLPADMVFE
ncbi:nuclear transport factor 2 family protein [Cellulomonas sp. NPDC055163]